jgi:hypothetical protein
LSPFAHLPNGLAFPALTAIPRCRRPADFAREVATHAARRSKVSPQASPPTRTAAQFHGQSPLSRPTLPVAPFDSSVRDTRPF